MTIYKRCALCGQPLRTEHISVYDCLKALIQRVEMLEDEILAKKLSEGLSRSSDPGPRESGPPPSFRSLAEDLVNKGD